MRIILIAAISLLPFSAFSQKSSVQNFSYKGAQIGDEVTAFAEKLPDYICKNNSCTFSMDTCQGSGNGILNKEVLDAYIKRGDACKDRTSFGGAFVSSGSAEFYDGKLSTIVLKIPAAWIEKINDVLIEKFGQPSSSDQTPLKNRLGVEFKNWSKEWNGAESSMKVVLRSGTIDYGSVTIEGNDAKQRRIENRMKHIEQGKKDF